MYKCGKITCNHKQKNHCQLQVKLLPGKLEKDLHTGSVTFSYNGSKNVTLRFVGKLTKKGSKDSEKEDTNNLKTMPVGQGQENVNQYSSRKFSIISGSVLILNDEWGTSKGGISTVHRQIARLAKDAGFNVYVTTLYKPSDEKNWMQRTKAYNSSCCRERHTSS
ncbi:uncharacterized protein [Ptychodera flava]|uniref:uncharacterized protein n=1 Tax=Ptychodera flava TaxID=63121 RepID=UPI003969E20F